MRPMTEVMLMMRPVRALIIARLNAFVTRNAPFKFVSSTVSQSASLMRMSRPSRVTPALLTRMSTLPASVRIFSAARAGDGGNLVGELAHKTPAMLNLEGGQMHMKNCEANLGALRLH